MGEILEKNNESLPAHFLHWGVGILGAAVFCVSVVRLPLERAGWEAAVLFILAIAVGSRISLYLDLIKSSISFADFFVFLSLLLFGPEVAASIAFIEAYSTSLRFTKKFEFRSFNCGTIALSIYSADSIAARALWPLGEMAEVLSLKTIGYLLLVVAAYYIINTGLMALSHAWRKGESAWKVWKEYYFWMIVPFLGCGSVALVAASISVSSGFYGFLVVLPIVGLISFTYKSQHKKLKILTERAGQTQKHLEEMSQSEERFRSAFQNAPIGMALISESGHSIRVNEALCNIFGLAAEDFEGRRFLDFLDPGDYTDFSLNVGLLFQRKIENYQAHLRYIDRAGNTIWSHTGISFSGHADEPRLIVQIQDITARRKAEEKLRHDAFYDSLTGLPNRAMFMQELKEAFRDARESKGGGFTVMFIDLDRFKHVNDSLGHTVGDKLLVVVAQRIKSCLPAGHTLSRFGGDEFLLLIPEKPESEIVKEVSLEILQRLEGDFKISGNEINLSASIGIAGFEPVDSSAEDILRHADIALHLAKSQGRSRSVFFTEDIRVEAVRKLKLEKDLHRAIERKELFLVYQPILRLESMHLEGFEALIRWKHPELRYISPLEFISIAEENGMIGKIGDYVLEEACRQLSEWRSEMPDFENISISINVSAKQLHNRNFFQRINGLIERFSIPAELLKLEITESAIFEKGDNAMSMLKQLRSLGVKLSMDDFGTGYSSLSYLHSLPFSTIKIDRAFVSQMLEKRDSAEIVRTIVLLARNLGLDVVAEGIETEEQLNALRILNCDSGQGYLFSKPLDARDAREYMAGRIAAHTSLRGDGDIIRSLNF